VSTTLWGHTSRVQARFGCGAGEVKLHARVACRACLSSRAGDLA